MSDEYKASAKRVMSRLEGLVDDAGYMRERIETYLRCNVVEEIDELYWDIKKNVEEAISLIHPLFTEEATCLRNCSTDALMDELGKRVKR